jgi:methanogenic corrinoid protein MtbC1
MQEWIKEAADPSRQKILAELRLGPKSVSELVQATGMRQPNVSNHLARMKEKGLVNAQRSGRRIYYHFASPEIQSAISSLLAPTRRSAVIESVTEDMIVQFARQAISGDEAACAEMAEAVRQSEDGLVKVYADLFSPVLVILGEWWIVKAINEAEEHLASAMIERLMARCMHDLPQPPPSAPKALLGCPAGSMHTIGLRMISDLLTAHGWRTYYLGANVPKLSFLAAMDSHQPDAVLVSCLLTDNAPEAMDLLRDMTAAKHGQTRPSLWVGGGGFRDSVEELTALKINVLRGGLREFVIQIPKLSGEHQPA